MLSTEATRSFGGDLAGFVAAAVCHFLTTQELVRTSGVLLHVGRTTAGGGLGDQEEALARIVTTSALTDVRLAEIAAGLTRIAQRVPQLRPET